jgi:hypothetical protein
MDQFVVLDESPLAKNLPGVTQIQQPGPPRKGFVRSRSGPSPPFGYPSERAAAFVSETIASFFVQKTSVERIMLVFLEASDVGLFL